MRRILITGGRAPVALDLARALSQAGHTVFMAESLNVFLSQKSKAVEKVFKVSAPNREPEKFLQELEEIILSEKIDILIPTCEEIFFVCRGHSRLSQICLLWADDFEKLKILHSKWAFIQKVNEIGLQSPETVLCQSRDDIKKILSQRPSAEKWVLKPVYSRFATKTKIGSAEDLNRNLNEIQVSELDSWVLQKFVSGTEYCTYSLAYKGKLLAHITYDHEFTAGKGAGICFDSVSEPKIENWIKKFVGEMDFTGQIAFDFIKTSDGNVFPLECNPRSTSGLHLIAPHPQFLSAIANPESATECIRLTQKTSGMITLAMWIYGLSSIRSFKRLKLWFETIVKAREVIFNWNDPRPFFTQFVCFYGFIKLSRKAGVTPLEASTLDIEWNGR